MTNWVLMRANGWEMFLPFVLTQAALLAYARAKVRPAWDIRIFLGCWIATVFAFLLWSAILRFRNNPPLLAAAVFMICVGTLCPFICSQIASALLSRQRSHLTYASLVFASGIFLGVPLLAVTNATISPLVFRLIHRQ